MHEIKEKQMEWKARKENIHVRFPVVREKFMTTDEYTLLAMYKIHFFVLFLR